MQQPLVTKPHITKFGKYIIQPIELSGTYLEYLLKNNLIHIESKEAPDPENWRNKTQIYQFGITPKPDKDAYNFVLEVGYLGKIKGKESELTSVKHNSSIKPILNNEGKSLKRRQIVTNVDGETLQLETDATYLLRVNQVINYMYQHIIKTTPTVLNNPDVLNKQFDLFKNKEQSIHISDDKLPQFIPTNMNTIIGDIFHCQKTLGIKPERTMYYALTLRSKTIVKVFKTKDGQEYILVGYPDWFKMVDHGVPIDEDILDRYENKIRKDSNYKLFMKFARSVGKVDLTDTQIDNEEELWKYIDGDTDIKCLHANFKSLYEQYLPTYQSEVSQYMKHHQVFNQCLTRIKYIFHIFRLNKETGKYEIFINSFQDLKSEQQEIFELVNKFIKDELYYRYLKGKYDKQIEKVVMSYVRFSGFFHIESEFIHPLSNYYQFNYMSYNVITLDELVHSLQYPEFWQKVNLDFFVTERKLSPIQSGGYPNSHPIDQDAIITLTDTSTKCHVVLIHTTHNKHVFAIIECDGQYIYLEIMGNQLEVKDQEQFTKEYIVPARQSAHQSLSDGISFDLELVNLGTINPYKITALYYVDKHPELYSELITKFLKFVPVVNIHLNNHMIQQIRQPSIEMNTYWNISLPYVIPFMKVLMLYNYLFDNRKLTQLQLLVDYNSRGKFCEGKPMILSSTIGNYKAIYYEDLASLNNDMSSYDYSKPEYYYIIWIISNTMYNKLQKEIDDVMINQSENDDINFNQTIKPQYLQKPTEIDGDKKYIRTIHDINKDNYEEIFQLIDNVLINLKITNPEIFIHTYNDICSKCLHIKIKSKDSYKHALVKAQYLTDNSRTLSYHRLKEFITQGTPNYYYDGSVNAYINLSWSFIFAYNILKQDMHQQSAGSKLITIKKIDAIPEYNKKIYENIRNSVYTYENYIEIINLTNINKVVMNVDNVLDNPTKYVMKIDKDSEIYNNLKVFNQLTNVDYQHWGGLQASIRINDLFNTGKLAIITNTLNIVLNIDQINNVKPFDVLLDNCDLSKKVCQSFSEKIEKSKNIKNIYGNYFDNSSEVYPKLIEQHTNKYKSIAIPNNGFYFVPYPTIFHPLNLSTYYMRLILGLFMLMDNGNMFIHKRVSFSYPLMEQYYDIITYFFNDVEYEFPEGDTYSENVFLYCFNFDRTKFLKYEAQFKQLLAEISKYTIQGKDFKDFSSDNFFYKNNKSSGKDIQIPYKLNIDIPSSQLSKSIMNIVSNKYYEFLDKVDYNMTRYLPLTPEKTMDILNTTVYDYVTQLIRFNEENKIPYNKYYLNFLDNYYEDVYKNIYSFSNNITVHIINYPNQSLSMKRRKSLTKNNKGTKSKSIKNHRDYLKKITGKNPEYKFDNFDPYIQKLLYVKQNKEVLVKKYGKDNMMQIKRVVEDFTKGVNVYLQQNFKINIRPSNAFTKLWEMYIQFNLVPNKHTIRMFHLAEAPGQFIKTTEYFIKKQSPKCEEYLWKANSLNPDSPEVKRIFGNNVIIKDEYGLIKRYKHNWIWGADNTGDITRSKNIRWYRKYLLDWLKGEKIDVITGDGGMTGSAPMKDLQKLDYGQFLLTVATSSIGKHCVIKIFTPFIGEDLTTYENSGGFFVGMLFLYSLLFKNLYLVKPYTSRPINGEYYIVGKGFMGLPDFAFDKLCDIMDTFTLNQTFFDKKHIPQSFVRQTVQFIEEMHDLNAKSLERQLFFLSCSHDTGEVAKKTNCKFYLNPNNLKKIHEERYKKWVKMFKFS